MEGDEYKLTKEDFLESLRDAAQDLADPEGEFNTMVSDFKDGADDVRPFDPVMAQKLMTIVEAFEGLRAHVVQRTELMTAPTDRSN